MADKTEEVVKSCAQCKKPVSRAKRYYRHGLFYCNKNCYKKKLEEAAEAAAKPDENA